ncbi:MAG: hypothetical protein WBA23_21125 [Tunicatimonas sp.]|uniref:hypothetical protein n=1 Tax=Tunicatimonas sp. TaxID=1940096 RepID=UPI003C712A2E
MKPLFVIFILFGSSNFLVAQSNETLPKSLDWSIRVNTGGTAKANLADGYYFSFDVGIPLKRCLQIAPTFSFSSVGSGNFFSNSWNRSGILSTSIPGEAPHNNAYDQDILGSVSILLLLNPLTLFNDQSSRHELLVGTGYGYKSYIQARTKYQVDGQNVETSSFSTKSNSGFEPYYFKLMYNYYFQENLFVGIVAGMDGYDGDAMTNIGLQFGVRF